MHGTVISAWRQAGACVVFYGTSLTRSGGWADVIGAEMQALNPELQFINTAEGGRESRWGREHFGERVIAHRPSLVFIEFAINDAVARFALPPEESAANLAAMLDMLRAAHPAAVPVLQIMNPVIDRPVGHDGHRPALADYEALWREVARGRQLTLVDHGPAWAGLLTHDESAFRRAVPDGLHPTLAGYEQLMLPTLRSAIGLPSVPFAA